VNVDTGAFQALTEQVADLAEQIRQLRVWDIYTTTFFDAGYRAGQDALLGRAAETSRPARPRPPHLRPVDGGAS
jgi:hypothetical protein